MLNLVVLNLAPSGFYEGQKTWFRPGQRMMVGSSQLADFVVPYDKQVRDIHCEVACDRERCTIRSASEGQVLVNDAPVTTATVRNGDRITIGGTTLTVELEERQSQPAARAPEVEQISETPVAAPALAGVGAADSADSLLSSALDRWLS